MSGAAEPRIRGDLYWILVGLGAGFKRGRTLIFVGFRFLFRFAFVVLLFLSVVCEIPGCCTGYTLLYILNEHHRYHGR